MSTTWYDVEESIRRWATDDWAAGYYDADNVDEWAHDTADGCEYTIYYHHQNALWADSAYVQSFEDMVYGIDDDIQQRIQACVYYAIYEECLNAARHQIESHGIFTVYNKTRPISVAGERIDVPVLAYDYTNPNR
jgi:hypothetical protein